MAVMIKTSSGHVATLDDEDACLAESTWTARVRPHTVYLLRWSSQSKDNPRRRLYLHRQVLERAGIVVPEEFCVDHINGDGLDNRRSNLRLASFSGNSKNRRTVSTANTSGFKGVSFRKSSGKWRAAIRDRGSRYFLGDGFASKFDAALAYDIAAIKLHGEYARLNYAGAKIVVEDGPCPWRRI